MTTHVQAFPTPGTMPRFLAGVHRQLDGLTQARQMRSRVEAALPLQQGERLLVLECTCEGDWLAATDQALYRPVGMTRVGGVPSRWSRLDWDRIERAAWRDRDGTLILTPVGSDPTAADTVIHMPPGATLGRFVGERVAWTTVVSATVQLDGNHGPARVVVRRESGGDDLRWDVTVPAGTSQDPGFHSAVRKALVQLRGQWGL